MIRFMGDTPSKEGLRKIIYEYDPKTDEVLLEELSKVIKEFLNSKQPTCFNCKNYYREGCFGGYMASACRIYGNIEALDNPHYDCDGSKCDRYQRANSESEQTKF